MKNFFVLFLCFLSLCAEASATLTPVKVALDWYINPDQAPLLVAQVNGYFNAQGLQVTFLSPTEETMPLTLIESHQADFGITNQRSLENAQAAGAPLSVVAELVNSPLSCMASIDPTIHSLKDLQGKTIGYSAGGSLTPTKINTMLRHAGVDLNTVKLINVKMDLLQALLSHRIDAAADVVRSVEVVELQQMGYHPTVFLPEQNGVAPYHEMLLITNTAHENPHTIQAFVTAVHQGATFLLAHPETSWQRVSQAYPDAFTPTPAMAKTNHAIWQAMLPYFSVS